jgi:hypothetical protein
MFSVRGQARAVKLQSGDRLVEDDGQTTAVESAISTERQEAVYNLFVAFDRTYFVGRREWGFSVWVHNTYTAATIETRTRTQLVSLPDLA